MTHLQFREQLIRDLVLAAEDGALNEKGIQRRRPSPVIPVVPSGDKALETLGSQGQEKVVQGVYSENHK
jgi:hypothetical protein